MKSLLVLILLCSIQISYAATLHGTVYDTALEAEQEIIVELNTTPLQRQVAKEGTYLFNVQKGTYTLTVKSKEGEILATEQVAITSDGDYIVDLFTLPDVEELDEFLTEEQAPDFSRAISWWPVIILIGIAMALGHRFYKKRKQKEPAREEDPLKEKICKLLKDNEYRMSQKELRKHFPFSEAKMSMALSELEHEGKVKKIKKGRTNIIALSR